MNPPDRLPLLVICGPTATGKTEMAVRVAERLAGEIVSADSMQIYRHLDIGTAKPTPEQRARVRFHLVDIVEPDEPYNVALFQRDARAAIEDVVMRGRLPILCGGTGLYIRAVTRGFGFPPGDAPEARELRTALEGELARVGNVVIHERLREIDPRSAERIAVADNRRLVRALEVYQLTGRPISQQQYIDEHQGKCYNLASFALNCARPVLYQRVNRRVEQMMASGWLDEVRVLLQRGYDPSLPALQAIGYRRLAEHLTMGGELGGTIELIQRDTRRFAKRQLTWFRREPGLIWLESDTPEQFDAAENIILGGARTLFHHPGSATGTQEG